MDEQRAADAADGLSREEATSAQSVQSVMRAVALLRCFAEGGQSFTLTELVRRTGLNVSTAYRLLGTLCASEVLARDPGSEEYHLGPLSERLARSVAGLGDRAVVEGVLQVLVDRTGESASLGTRDGEHVVIVLRMQSSAPLRFDRPPNTRVAMHASAMGKALLAFSSSRLGDAVRDAGELHSFTPKTITSRRKLEQDLRTARARGYTVVDEEHYIGVRSVGAPIIAANGEVCAAVAVQGPVARLADDRLDDIGIAVRDTAQALERLPEFAHLIRQPIDVP